MDNRIRYIVLLVLLAGIGLMASQAYWLRSTFLINKERFEKDVNEALKEALDLLIVGHAREVVIRSYNATDITNLPENKHEIEQTSLLLIPDEVIDTGQQKIAISAYYELDDSSKNKRRHRIIKAPTGQDTTFNFPPTEVDELMNKILASLIDKKLDMNKLDSIYQLKLQERHIETSYFLELSDGDSLLATTRPEGLLTDYPISAHVHTLLPHGTELRAIFPKQDAFIFRQLGWIIGASFLLIIITIGSFLYMLRVIFDQKKLSVIKNDFINNMTHELKTPISILSAANEALTNFDALNDQSKTMQYLNISKKELERLNIMVEKVLNISVYEKPDFSLKREAVNVNELIQSLIEQYKVRYHQTLQLQYESGIYTKSILLDKVHFYNILNNLIDNAIKYSKPKHEITIQSSESDAAIQIVVADNGIGIAPQYQRVIFDKFFRVPTGDLHTVKGFGLGLSYVKSIIEKHGGNIQVESKIGQGSTFVINIPKA